MDEFEKAIKEAMVEAEKYHTCMSLCVNQEGKSVELILDTSRDTYGEWIKGEGSDISLIRDQETNKVIGVRLPLYNDRLCIHHDGPIRINAGFRKTDED